MHYPTTASNGGKDHCKHHTVFFLDCDVGSHVSSGNLPSPGTVSKHRVYFYYCISLSSVFHRARGLWEIFCLPHLTSTPATHYQNHKITYSKKTRDPENHLRKSYYAQSFVQHVSSSLSNGLSFWHTNHTFALNVLVIEHFQLQPPKNIFELGNKMPRPFLLPKRIPMSAPDLQPVPFRRAFLFYASIS